MTHREATTTREELLLQPLLAFKNMAAHTPQQEAMVREMVQPLLEFHPLLATTSALIERGKAPMERAKELLSELSMAMSLPESASVPELRARLMREAQAAMMEAEVALRETKLALRESEARLDSLEPAVEYWERTTEPGREEASKDARTSSR